MLPERNVLLGDKEVHVVTVLIPISKYDIRR